jgi:uncharacterized membrane protein YbaN (DUF454 family)
VTLLWRLAALLCLLLALIGLVLPVLPTVPFLLLAAAAGPGWTTGCSRTKSTGP